MGYNKIAIKELFGLLFGSKIKRTGNKYKKQKPVSE